MFLSDLLPPMFKFLVVMGFYIFQMLHAVSEEVQLILWNN